MTTPPSFAVHVAAPTLEHGTPPVPHGHPAVASPIASTLIVGEVDAVLVDTPWTHEHVQVIGDWIDAFGKRLTGIYITHGHGDHWMGAAALLDRFPSATVYATEGTAAYMADEHEHRYERWENRFPGLVAQGAVHPHVVGSEGFELEGNSLLPIELGHTDTDQTTALWVPDLRLVVAGDSVYNHAHQYLNESPGGGLESWHRALDTIEALDPLYAVAGHKDESMPDDAGAIGRTRHYLDTFAMLKDEGGRTPEEFFDEMLARFPGYANPKALWRSIVAVGVESSPSA